MVSTRTPPTRRGSSRPTVLRSLVKAARPGQWLKNGLVLAAPVAAGALFGRDVLLATALAFISFCLASSSGYLVNDTVDREVDRAHPTKRTRPLAAGTLSPVVAVSVALVLAVASLGLAAIVSRGLVLAVGAYLVLALSYSLGLKHQPVLDLGVVTGLFVVRAVAGGVAADLPISQWFLIVSAFGSLFLVSGKRYSELVLLGDDAAAARPSLAHYTGTYLRFVWGVAAGVAVTAYCLWAFEVGEGGASAPWAALSVAPFVIALLRYARDIDSGRAGAPDQIALHDRVLQVLVLVWGALFSLEAFGV
jgi:decaprenyl-phosphate phosphoribosyltransferase